jgi:hypothetical protein
MVKIITNNCDKKNTDKNYKFYPTSAKSNILIQLINEEVSLGIQTQNYITVIVGKNILKITENSEKIIKTSENITINIDKINSSNNKIYVQFLKKKNMETDLKKITTKYPYLFHKYMLGISNPNEPIQYLNIQTNINIELNYWLHIHCCDLNSLVEYFQNIINDYTKLFNIIVTYCQGEIIFPYDNITWLKIKNQGADIGGKICAINYLQTNSINYEYVLFTHSKTDLDDRLNYLMPFESRAELIVNLLTDGIKKIDAIFPNYHNIVYNDKINSHTIKPNHKYLKEFLNWMGIDYDIKKTNWFNGTNTFLFSKSIIDFIFSPDKILHIYNILNHANTFDYCWYIKKYNIKDKDKDIDIDQVYNHYLTSTNIGNCWTDPTKSIPNCCTEHMFERSWINIIKHLKLNFICLPSEKIFDFYQIKLNAIYFPQYHNSPENNKFWGEGFTEWVLLKPYPDKITVRDNPIAILKPHNDIGYYSLDSIEIFKKQCTMAKSHGLNGFVIYHYWFGNSHSVLNRVEQHILSGMIDPTFQFCFSWANEPWTKRWDGLNNDVMIEQNYEDDLDLTHIEYLAKFFVLPNYIKNSQGECLFYIYNFSHIKKHFTRIKSKWDKYLLDLNLTVQFISTENAIQSNKKSGTQIRFDFLPMSATECWKSHSNSLVNLDGKINEIKQHFEIDYCDLIDKFNLTRTVDKYHFGIPLSWNNIIRRNGLSHLHINNFNEKNLEKMFLRTFSKIILKYTNKFESKPINKYNVIKIDLDETNYSLDDNIIVINAWNEWNEQAVLEPTITDGYLNLETIYKIIKL